jgi:GNAT superfamily N-acetyltransferase
MIRPCADPDFENILAIINDGARAYQGVIPPDCLSDPYMSAKDLHHEIDDGVQFWGYEDDDLLFGVMGIQQVEDISLIRHAYVRTGSQNRGIGAQLISHLLKTSDRPILIGTWAAASWAIRFYHRHGFRTVTPAEKDRLLRHYWTIPERQIETSVVLADSKWTGLPA